MLENTDIYAPQTITGAWAALAIGSVLGGYGLVFLVRFINKRRALKRQRRLLTITVQGAQQVVQQALADIADIRAKLVADSIASRVAAEDLSVIMRQTTDTLKNHRTRYLSRHEITERHLAGLAKAVDLAYPPEFSAGQVDKQHVLLLCDDAERVVRACL